MLPTRAALQTDNSPDPAHRATGVSDWDALLVAPMLSFAHFTSALVSLVLRVVCGQVVAHRIRWMPCTICCNGRILLALPRPVPIKKNAR